MAQEHIYHFATVTCVALTSRMLGMMSFSHCLRNESLSKLGSTFKISVRTSDISVLENKPPMKEQRSPMISFFTFRYFEYIMPLYYSVLIPLSLSHSAENYLWDKNHTFFMGDHTSYTKTNRQTRSLLFTKTNGCKCHTYFLRTDHYRKHASFCRRGHTFFEGIHHAPLLGRLGSKDVSALMVLTAPEDMALSL